MKSRLCYQCLQPFDKRTTANECPHCGVKVLPSGMKPSLCSNCSGILPSKSKVCPHCKAELVLKVESRGGANVLVKDAAPIPVPVVLDKPAQDITITRLDDATWRVDFKVMVPRAVCPNCTRMAFVPRIANGSVIHKCDRCKHTTTFNFDFLPRNRVI